MSGHKELEMPDFADWRVRLPALTQRVIELSAFVKNYAHHSTPVFHLSSEDKDQLLMVIRSYYELGLLMTIGKEHQDYVDGMIEVCDVVSKYPPDRIPYAMPPMNHGITGDGSPLPPKTPVAHLKNWSGILNRLIIVEKHMPIEKVLRGVGDLEAWEVIDVLTDEKGKVAHFMGKHKETLEIRKIHQSVHGYNNERVWRECRDCFMAEKKLHIVSDG